MIKSTLALAFTASLSLPLYAQDAPQEPTEKILTPEAFFAGFKEAFPSAQNEGLGKIGTDATIDLSNDLIFLNGEDGDKLMQSWGNLPSPIDGLVMPVDGSWCITFEFSPIGYVKDDEKEDIDADEILEEKQDAQKEANKERVKQGLDNLNIIKWVAEPNYNSQTNNLEWGMLLRDDTGSETINHEIRLLGRRGVMNATLLCSPEEFDSLRPVLDSTLEGFAYTDGNKYMEYKEGDKVAEYGLLGLMGAGGAFVIWKFWKPICAGVIAVGVGIKKFFNRFTGGDSEGRIS